MSATATAIILEALPLAVQGINVILGQLIQQMNIVGAANSEGRDVTDAELAQLRAITAALKAQALQGLGVAVADAGATGVQ